MAGTCKGSCQAVLSVITSITTRPVKVISIGDATSQFPFQTTNIFWRSAAMSSAMRQVQNGAMIRISGRTVAWIAGATEQLKTRLS